MCIIVFAQIWENSKYCVIQNRYNRRMKTFFIIASFLLTATMLLEAFEETGLASWYGGKFQGRLTASGERFDTNKLTAAHKTLPFGTIVEVMNLEDHSTVQVRINDRGPFIKNRVIDLSRASAQKIGLTSRGIVKVRIRIIQTKNPIVFHRLQTGAFSLMENAVHHKNKIEAYGFQVMLISGNDKLIRAILPDIPEESIQSVKAQLKNIGITTIFIYNKKDD